MNKSIERVLDIQSTLSELSDSIEDTYYAMRKEIMDEVIENKREYLTKKNEMSSLFDKLSTSNAMKMKWIKNKLPWYITKFHKISSYEISLRDTSIFIGVCFGKSNESSCYIEITPKDIGWQS